MMTSEQRDQLHKYMGKRARTGFPCRGLVSNDWHLQFTNRDGHTEIAGRYTLRDFLLTRELNEVLKEAYPPLNEIDIDLIMAYVPARWPA